MLAHHPAEVMRNMERRTRTGVRGRGSGLGNQGVRRGRRGRVGQGYFLGFFRSAGRAAARGPPAVAGKFRTVPHAASALQGETGRSSPEKAGSPDMRLSRPVWGTVGRGASNAVSTICGGFFGGPRVARWATVPFKAVRFFRSGARKTRLPPSGPAGVDFRERGQDQMPGVRYQVSE